MQIKEDSRIAEELILSSGNLTVEKIGGTSMTALSQVLDNIIFHDRTGQGLYNRVFVVSAFAGVTDMLLENKKTGSPGVYHRIKHFQDFHLPLLNLVEGLKLINRKYASLGLDLEAADIFIEGRVGKACKYLESLSSVMSSGYVSNDDNLQAAREILASIGEAHSAYNLSQILKNRGVDVQLIDLCGIDDHRALSIDQRIRRAFRGVDFSNSICVVTGYAKGSEGLMREFDRGYSDITFSKVAQILKPREAIIHKEYHLSSADPMIVGKENCCVVGRTNYDIADQLADVGMEAIHPKASKPLEMANINLRIKNTFDPDHMGTLITGDYVSAFKKVEIISGSDKMLVIDVYDSRKTASVSCDLQLMQVLEKHGLCYVFKATSANSISTAIWEKDCSKRLLSDLKSCFQTVSVEEVAIVCLLGSNMDRPGLLAQSADALSKGGINIKSVSFAMRKVSIQFLISRADYKKAVAILNAKMANHVIGEIDTFSRAEVFSLSGVKKVVGLANGMYQR